LKNIRLMVSGSMSMPTPILEKWEKVTGHNLLERYGMSELGMVLSQPLNASDRIPGTVGVPLPGVQVKIVSNDKENSHHSDNISDDGDITTGELYVAGPSVFSRYFRREAETISSFSDKKDDDEGRRWFKTGDMVLKDNRSGVFRMLGRGSVDIIKSKGYKISALEIERVLLAYDSVVSEVVIVGLPDETYGQCIAAVVTLSSHFKHHTHPPPLHLVKTQEATTGGTGNKRMNSFEEEILVKLRSFASEALAHYKLPTIARVVDAIPKNSMGKINKKDLVCLFD
jgi:malonyl-CoA/methylmalonyl-CoA synthetase